MTDITIEKMKLSHLKRLAALEKVSFSTPWSEAGLRDELTRKDNRFFVASDENGIIGYIGANNVLGEVYITNIAVFPDFKRHGVGELLVNHLVKISQNEKADFVTLEVRESNEPAKRLYKKLGFSEVGKRTNFYEKPREDALIFTRYLLNGESNENTRN